jgi:hypothetical protein
VRNDVGGVIDATVVAMAVGSLLWDYVLVPHMRATQAHPVVQAATFIAIFALTGVLGALGRLLQAATEFIPALWLLCTALALGLVANVAVQLATDTAGDAPPAWTNMLYMGTYTAVGGVGLAKSTTLLLRPGPAPPDDLTPARLAFLGLALAAVPVVGGSSHLLGREIDGLLLTLGGTAIVPLVMVRIGRLAAQRAQAQRALLHEATHDALTGLPNRREFLARLSEELGHTGPERAGPVILFCDLDGFKVGAGGCQRRRGHRRSRSRRRGPDPPRRLRHVRSQAAPQGEGRPGRRRLTPADAGLARSPPDAGLARRSPRVTSPACCSRRCASWP